MSTSQIPTQNPAIIFREDFDEIAILFNPENGKAFSLNRTGIIVWKLLDGTRSIQDIAKALVNSPDKTQPVIDDVSEFIDCLVKNGLAGYVVR